MFQWRLLGISGVIYLGLETSDLVTITYFALAMIGFTIGEATLGTFETIWKIHF